MSRTVLVPVDGSPLSSRALRYALREFPDAEIVAYHVVDLFEPDTGAYDDLESPYEPMLGSDEWFASVSEATDRLFAELSEIAADYDRSIATESDIGDPSRLVLEYATDEPVDHIVLGAHGRIDESRSIFGSVAETVVRRAQVPVTIVR
ncbi:universal stress protein [Natronococcus pandeyae]|uniref:Universal stress protein n=1 Tax=Natronococcus pandeyae TaxID=2055836 RepID=A0A8J8Q131_9EURY|nr:universal stress protein [Natronococcus pandeyae]TYL36553.1 universal stress protein [Natronococcus pandeyae]